MPLLRLIAVTILAVGTAVAQDGFVRHLKFLASDDLRGRGNYDPRTELAAEYIADVFRSLNIEPGGEDGGYFQEFDLPVWANPGNGSSVTFLYGGIYPDVQEFRLIGYADRRTLQARLAFAGYGITSDGYDDYAGLDVRGRVVMVLEGEPPLRGGEATPFSTLRYKIANARDHGASGVLFVQGPRTLRSGSGRSGGDEEIFRLGIAAFRAHPRWSWEFRGFLGARQEAIDGTLVPRSSTLDQMEVRLDLDVEETFGRARNVLGFIQGTSDEIVVLGAHYDHIGVDGPLVRAEDFGRIHNGADDNASGCAALLQLAGEWAQGPAPRRSILLIAFAGEELGLLGSRHFLRSPTVEIERVAAMLNLDMIGRSRGDLLVLGTGTAEEFQDIVRAAGARSPLRLRTYRSPTARSDHQPFADAGIPTLFFTSGNRHREYHSPRDDWHLIDIPRTLQAVDVVGFVAESIVRLPERPRPVDLRPAPDTAGMLGLANSVVLGIGQDSNWPYSGIRLETVYEGTPAFEAGLIEGDILIGLGGLRIDNFYDFSFALEERDPGEEIDVMILREGELLTLPVRLAPTE